MNRDQIREQAIREIVENWPTLDEATQQRLRALLRPVPEDRPS